MTLFTLGKLRTPEPTPRIGEIARGAYWAIVREGDDYLLCHLSAALHGREERRLLRETEARAILAGDVAVEYFLPPADASRFEYSNRGLAAPSGAQDISRRREP